MYIPCRTGAEERLMAMRKLSIALALTAMIGTAPLLAADSTQGDITEKTLAAIAALDSRGKRIASTYLKDRVPGEPVACLPPGNLRRATSASDDVLLYESGSVVYVNSPDMGCPHARNNAKRTMNPGPRLCSGAILQVFDQQVGAPIGTCTLNAFIPFRKIEAVD